MLRGLRGASRTMTALASARCGVNFFPAAAPTFAATPARGFFVSSRAAASDDGETPAAVPGSAHGGFRVKRTKAVGASERRRTADPSDPKAPDTGFVAGARNEFHGRRRVKKYVRHVKDAPGTTSRFPYLHDSFCFDGKECTTEELMRAFEPQVSQERIARLDAVVEKRSFDLMPILEGVYDIGNVLAVCRSTEALGIGSLGVISDAGLAFKQSGRTSGGAVKWTNLEQWRSTADAVADAKARGYRVLTTVFEGGHPLEHYDWTVPTAVVLGNERDGVSDEAKALADGGVYINMNGFTESLNVSVASAMIMHHAVQSRTKALGSHGNLSDKEKETLRAVYLARLVPRYQKQGYLRQLLERSERDHENAEAPSADDECVIDGEDEDRCEETDDEVFLLNALEVAKIVKRPRKKKFGRPAKDDHARIMTEVETVRADGGGGA